MTPLLPLALDTLSGLTWVIEVVATLAFALAGAIEAARRRLDAVGVVVAAFLTAFGGGTLRDVLLDRRPFFWVEHSALAAAVLGLCIGAMAVIRARHLRLTERAIFWPDTLGLGLFGASGTQIALAAQMPPLIAVLMGVITAVFGGVLRDMVCNQIPATLRDHRPYALCVFAGGWAMVGVRALGGSADAALLAAAAVAIVLRWLAVTRDWRLPAWRMDE
jgi:uncharacterized membrane protein YeiH